MKTIHTISILAVFLAATVNITAQNYPDEYLGLPGDNLNLYAVMNMFQESETLEGFERSLNDEESMVNNLDLNGDNLIDYVTVSDFVEGDVHTIVLRAALNRNEQQDVAVFVVEKLRGGAVQIQLIGDEALYGPNYIVEPIYAETSNPGYTGNTYNRSANMAGTTYYEIATWPMVRYIYNPRYIGWRSSWSWGYYPSYWRPWRAHYWHYYYGYHSHWHDHYYTHYRHWDRYRCNNYQTYYHSNVRVYSPNVVVNINNGRYRNTYSRPDKKHAGEQYYANNARTRTQANRTGKESTRNSAMRNTTPASMNRSDVSANRRSNASVRATSNTRSNAARSTNVQTSRQNSQSAVQRSQSSSRTSSSRKSTPAVQRSNNSRSSTPAVQRSSSRSSNNKASTVQRSQPSKSSVQRSSSSSRKSTPAVQRSSTRSSNNKASTVQRSQPSKSSVQRSSSSSRKSTPAVQRSSSRSSSSKASTAQRSQPSKSKSSVQRSSSSSKKSTPSAQRSSSSSSRKSSDGQRSSSSSRR